MNTEKVRCLIIGSGPAGFTAAIYASRANLSPVLYQGITPGGQLTTTTDIENFPGYPKGISGTEMMEDLQKQAERFGTDVRHGIVTHSDFSHRPFTITIDGSKKIKAETVIIATGATAKYLGLPSESKYMGMGVSGCAVCDGFFYKKKRVAVVGGGDTACEDALYLSTLASKVYMIVRKDHLRASHIMQKRVKEAHNIEIMFEYNTKEILGDDDGVTGALLEYKDGREQTIDIDGFFLAIGHHPNVGPFKDCIELTETGYIKTIPGTSKTNVPGVFAAGDVQDPVYHQAITAAGSGCIAAIDAERFLMEHDR